MMIYDRIRIAENIKMKKNDNNEWMKAYAKYGYLGFMFPVALFVGYIIGNFLDGKLDSSPIFALVFMILGFAGALRTLLKEIDRMDREEK
ncbi:MAG: AtpZ/AtpI family protein [Acidobacteria bacterium]|nr:AtpZ/AtpI family protein [Acidobacteriota bacterium]